MTVPYARCKACGARRTKRRHISKRGLCRTCAIERETENIVSMVERNGPQYAKWRAGMRRFAERLDRTG